MTPPLGKQRQSEPETTHEWLAFYSAVAQREYYVNPKTNIVTWILPDEDHPDGKKQQQEASDDALQTRQLNASFAKNDKPTRSIRQRLKVSNTRLFWFTFSISMVVTLLLWAYQEGVLVFPAPNTLQIEEVNASSVETGQVESSTTQNDKRQWKLLNLTPDRAMSVASTKTNPPINLANKSVRGGPVIVPKEQTRNTDLGAAVDSKTSTIAQKRTVVGIGTATKSPQQSVHDTSTRPKRGACVMPFAHVFSKRCKEMAKEIFDLEPLLDTMMQ